MATVLVVDDDRSLQALISEALRAEGFDVAVERDGAQAVARFEHAPADAILLDVLLPGLNGFQVAERIRALPSGRAVPIVMMSGTYRGQKTSDAARAKLGLAGYIEKPFQLSVLIASLRDALTPKPIAFAQTASPSMARAPHGASAREARPTVVGAARLALRMKVGERALAWVFAELFRRRATGVLVLTRPGQQATLAYFREGLAVGAVCRGRAHHLGQLLVRDRVIEAGELEHVRLYAQGTGMRLAAALIATSHASAEILAAIAVRRFDRALVDAFGWGDGEARFFLRDRLPAGTPASSPQPPTALLYHLIRTGMSGVELAKELAPRLDERPVAAREQAWALFTHLPPQERDLLLSLDGRTSLREVIAAQSVEDAPALLLTAMCLGLILPSNAASLQAAQRAASPAPSVTETPPPWPEHSSKWPTHRPCASRFQSNALAASSSFQPNACTRGAKKSAASATRPVITMSAPCASASTMGRAPR